jgi:sigma-B regulation protein RsbU (phosphoserine phosphatase)
MDSNGNHDFTMIYGLLNIRSYQLRFTVAGHPAPILFRDGSPPERLDAAGMAIGMFDEAEFEESVIQLESGDRLYLHSDGLTEEMNAQDEEFGDDRLLAAIADSQGISLQGSVESRVQQVVAWRGGEHLRDDVSLLAVSVT